MAHEVLQVEINYKNGIIVASEQRYNLLFCEDLKQLIE